MAVAVGAMLVHGQDTYYSSETKELFFLADQAAIANSDLCFTSDAMPTSNPARIGQNLNGRMTNRLSLGYAGFFENSFGTSVLPYSISLDDRSGCGVVLGYLYVPGIIDNTGSTVGLDSTIQLKEEIGFASITHFRAGYSYTIFSSKRLNVSTGAVVNARRTNLLGETGYGIGVDAGLALLSPRTGLAASVVVNNLFGHAMRWSADYSDFAYPQLRVGLGYSKEIPYLYGSITITVASLDLFGNEGVNDNGSDPRWLHASKMSDIGAIIGNSSLGIAYEIADRVTLRVGHSDLHPWTIGAGIGLFNKRLIIDCAYLDQEIAGTYQLSLTSQW